MSASPHIRAGVLENYQQTVLGLGGDPQALLAAADISPEALEISGSYIPYANYLRLHEMTARTLNCPQFGLLMARVGSAETLGMTGFIMLQADTVEGAWRSLAHFYRAHDTFGDVDFGEQEGRALMTYRLPRVDLPGSRQAFDVAAGISTNIMRQLCGDSWHPVEIGLPYPQPADLADHEFLRADKLSFDAPCYQMFFHRRWLQHPLAFSNPNLHDLLGQYFSAFQQGQKPRIADQVEEIVRGLLPLGTCALPQVASLLALSPRGLQARLAAEQTSFQRLLDGVRQEIAVHHLTVGDMQFTQLAMILGYSELSAFTRSFKRWFGVSPRQYLRRRPLPG